MRKEYIIKMLMNLLLLIVLYFIFSKFLKKFKVKDNNYHNGPWIPYRPVHMDKGTYGEYLTYKELEYIKGPHRILTNVYLPTRNGNTTEIDLIYIHESGIYVLESKNYGGWIFGNERDRTWTQVFKSQRKEKFYNPITQNRGHINNLMRVLNISPNYVKSIIVFSERCTLKNITVYSSDVRVVKRNDLVRTLNGLIRQSSVRLSENQIIEIYNNLHRFTNVSDSVKNQHINYVNNTRNRYTG